MKAVTFGRADIENTLAGMTPEEIDRLPFGAIQVDREGYILLYSATEGALTSRDPETMIGKNFFTDIAPCGQTDAFYGRFRRGIEQGVLNTIFDYTFDDRMTPMKVRIHLKRGFWSNTYWIFVKRLIAQEAAASGPAP